MTDQELQAKIHNWLKEQGYPLEYATARAARRAGFGVFQSITYLVDGGDTAKAREVDVVARYPSEEDDHFVGLVVECKTGEKPWLVLTVDAGATARVQSDALIHANVKDELRVPACTGWTVPARRGFGLVQALRKLNEADTAYQALAGVVSAARGVAADRGADEVSPALLVPVVVVSGALYQLGYGEDGTELLEPVEWTRIMWHRADRSPQPTLVDIVRQRHLDPYLQMMTKALELVDLGIERYRSVVRL